MKNWLSFISKFKRGFFTLSIFLVSGFFISLYGQSWKLIESAKFPKQETFVATLSVLDHGAKGDGVTDNTQTFQRLLDQLATYNGGTLYVPEGKYVIKGALNVPKGITIRGDWKKPQKNLPIEGTIIMAYSGKGDASSAPLFTLEPGAGIMDLAIWYPEQTPDNIQQYPASIMFGKTGYWGNDYCNAKNITFVNSYIGLMLSRVNGGGCPIMNHLYGTPLAVGVEIDNIADVGRIENINFSPEYWASSGLPHAPASGSSYKNWIYNNGTGIVMRRNDWSYTCYVDIEGYSVGMLSAHSLVAGQETSVPNGHNYAMTFTRCKTGVYSADVNDVGVMYSNIKMTDCENGFVIGPNTSGTVQIQASEISATAEAVKIDKSSSVKTLVNQCVINKGVVNAAGGILVANDCNFKNQQPQIALGIGARSVLTGNCFTQEVKIDDKSIVKSVIDHSPLSIKKVPDFTRVEEKARKPSRSVMYLATVAPYNANGNGVKDNTTAIQSALDKAAADGGGVVFLPPGNYKVTGNLSVPTGVELKGAVDLSSAPLGKGTIIEVYTGKGNPNGQPFMKLAKNSGIRGIVFNYPEQRAAYLPNMFAYPYTVQVTGSDAYIINVGMRAVDKFADLFTYKCDNHFVDYVMGHVFNGGIKVGANSENGVIQNVHVNIGCYATGGESKWGSWPNSPIPGIEESLVQASYKYGLEKLDFIELGACKNQRLYNNFIYGAHKGLILGDNSGNGPEGISMGTGIDGTTSAVCIEKIGTGGFDFINTQLVAIGDNNTWYIETGAGFTGSTTFFNSDYWGNPSRGMQLRNGTIELQSANFHHPGQSGLATLNHPAKLSFVASTVAPTDAILTDPAEAQLSVQSSVLNPSGINPEKCALWKNNLDYAIRYTTEYVYDRTGWTATASHNNNKAYMAIDSKPETRWDTGASQASGQWFIVDMKKVHKLDAIILDVAASAGDSPVSYKMYLSDDGQTWTSAVASGKGTRDVSFIYLDETTKARYIKIEQTGQAGNYWSIHELYVYNADLKKQEIPLDRTGWIASASKNNDGAQRTLDDDLSTRWDTEAVQESGEWFQVDMLQPQKFNKIHLDYTESPNDGPDKYEIYVSDDGELWGEPIASGGGTKSTLKIELDDQEARYIRILQTGTNEGGYWSIHEFWAYNNEKEIETVKFEILPTPSNATVQINGVEQSFAIIEKGKDVTYKVSAEGYVAVEDTRSNLQSDIRIEVKLEAISVPKVRFEIMPTPSNAIVTINGIEQKITEIEKGMDITYKVSAAGYITVEETLTDVHTDMQLEVNLTPAPSTKVRFEIIPTPSDATVIINGSEQKTAEIPKGQDITYKVSAEGYISEEKTLTNMQSDKQLRVILNPMVSDTDKEISFSYNGHYIKVRGTIGEFRLRVYSVSGKCLIDNTTKGDVPFICPASGVYILRLDYEGSKYEKKVFLNK